jgi:predicted transcriptional regulator
MNIKLDENLRQRLSAARRKLGHDTHTVFDENLSGYPDRQIWEAARFEHWRRAWPQGLRREPYQSRSLSFGQFFSIRMDNGRLSGFSSRVGYLSTPAAVEEDLDFFWRQAIVGVPGFRATANRGKWGETNDAQVV